MKCYPRPANNCRIILVLALLYPLLCTASEPLFLDPVTWKFNNTGKFESWTDRRGLMVLHHPWEVSEKDFFADAERVLTIPADWVGPFKLHFYMTDDYDASTAPVTEGWLGQINLIGHRFKQLLINGEVVWQHDVADATDIALPTRFTVALPESLKPGDTFRIALRLMDVAGSMERLPGDHRHVGDTDAIQDNDPWKFMTHLYFGDVVLAPAAAEVLPGVMPSLEQVRALHASRGPVAPASTAANFPVLLPLRHAPVLGAPFPLYTGVPFPIGAVTDPTHIRMANASGSAIPSSARVMNTWPDGSIRTAVIAALPGAATASLQLRISSTDIALPPPPGGLQITSGTGNDGTLRFNVANGKRAVSGADAALTIDGKEAAFFPEATEIIEESPIHREVEIRGHIRSGETEFGRFVLRLLTFSGQPCARIQFRVFHDLPGTRAITRMALRFPWPREHPSSTTPGAEGLGLVSSIIQEEADLFRVIGAGNATRDGQVPGWLGISGDDGALLVVVRDFAEQYPIALTDDGSALTADLFSPTEAMPAYAPHEGEAKRYEIWLGVWDLPRSEEEFAGHAEWMSNPPGLFNVDYACTSGAFGAAAPHDERRFPALTAFMKQTYADIPASMFYTTGIRNWGDLPYNAEEGTWRNGYYDTQQGLFSEYLMTADARWFDHLEASVRHVMDIDVCHASREHPEWIGAIHGLYSNDHSTGDPWNPTQRTKGMLNYARLTGDRDARATALGVADSALATGRALGAVSVRDHAGILYALVAAWDETRDPKYLEGARALAHDAMKRIDPRRGTYSEIHGNYGYRGNVPWMVAQLMEPMYDYYRASGDLAAAEAVVGMAESILAENRTRGVDGDVYGYSHNPHFAKSSSYHILIAPAILYAYELTTDAEFLKQGRAMYNQTIAEGTVNSVMNCYWNTHTLLYYLNQYAAVGAD